jgi:hypothetical protein
MQPLQVADRNFNEPVAGPRLEEGMVEMLVTRYERFVKELVAINKETAQVIAGYLAGIRRNRKRSKSVEASKCKPAE